MKAKKFFIHCRKLSAEVIFRSLVLLVLIVPMFAGVSPARAAEGDVEWIRTIATGDIEPGAFNYIKTTPAPDGNVYLLGTTSGDLPGLDMMGYADIFVRKYTPEGDELWTRMLGTTGSDVGQAIAADPTGVYFAGFTEGTFDGQVNTSGHSALIGKYDPEGNLLWIKQLGDPSQTEAQEIAVAGGRLYVIGTRFVTSPTISLYLFVEAYNTADGTQVFSQTFPGYINDAIGGIAVSDSAVYVAGNNGINSSQTMFLKQYSLEGVEGWTVSFQSDTRSYDRTMGVGVFGPLVYVAGYTAGTLPGGTKVGNTDGFVKAFNLDGTDAWVRQFGASATSGVELHSLAVDSSGVYLAGITSGAFPGSTNLGDWDGFIRRYGLAGEEGWTLQFGTAQRDLQDGLSVDTTGIYVSGRTNGALDSQASSGVYDAFLKKVSLDSSSLWTKQFSSDNYVPNTEIASAVDAAGNAYIAGSIEHYISYIPINIDKTLFIAKYSPAGEQEWIDEFQSQGDPSSTPYRTACGVAVGTDGSVYLVGGIAGVLPGQINSGYGDVYLRKYDANGNELWTRQFGSEGGDGACGVAVDSTGVYVAGNVNGQLGAIDQGGSDAFVRKYDLDGGVVWTDQFGTSSGDSAAGITSDGTNIYVSGGTSGVLGDGTSSGSYDGFVRKYTPEGGVLWTHQFGSDKYDVVYSVAADMTGVYVGGYTEGTLTGQTRGLYMDAFILKFPSEGSDPLWIHQFDTGFNEFYKSVTVNESGVFVGGFSSSHASPYPDHALLQKYSPNGEILWEKSFTDNSIHHINGVAVDDTGIYLSGFQTALAHTYSRDAALVKLSLGIVGNEAPVVGAITAPAALMAVNTVVSASAGFTDANTSDTHTATWDWGNGTTSIGTITESNGSGTASGAYTYTVPGVYEIKITVADQAGLEGSTTYQYVVVYDPSAGFVTGGGWIDSPDGAYKADVTLSGRATFGFVSKYQKGSSIPTGNTAFQFDLAGLSFASQSYEWLVVNQGGTNAQFKGSGLINAAAAPNGQAYKFMLWAGDGASTNGADTFRIRIWYEDAVGEHEVYDNGVAQAIGGGNIVVHTKK